MKDCMYISFEFRNALNDRVHTYNTAWEGRTMPVKTGSDLSKSSIFVCHSPCQYNHEYRSHKTPQKQMLNWPFKIIKIFLKRTSNTKSVILFSAINLWAQRKNFQFSLLIRHVYFRVSSKNSILQDPQHSDSVLILLRENQILTMFFSEKHIPLGIIERGDML